MKGKNMRLRFKKPIIDNGRVQFIAEKKLKNGWVTARYTLPKAEIKKDGSGKKYIHIAEGPIGARPRNLGVGSSFLRQTQGIFREIARRTGMDVLHVTTPATRDSKKFFVKYHNYKKYKPAEYSHWFRYKGGKPQNRSENVEQIMHKLMGDKLYWEGRKSLRKN